MTIPQATKDRIFRAAEELNYRPNPWARSLRTKRTRMISVVTPDFGRATVARVVAGAQRRLRRSGYLLMLESLDAVESHAHLHHSGIEGVISIDAPAPYKLDLPVAAVELGYIEPADTIPPEIHSWLSDLGEAAAETIVRQIEKQAPARKILVEATFRPDYIAVPNAALGSGVRETA
jgi:hypothetical protein